MCKLYIDTSQAFIILGLLQNGIFFEKILKHENKMGSHLSLSVKKFIEDQGCDIQSIQQITCGVGPGSYTGTRVGVAFAESLAFGLDIPLIKVPSLLFYIRSDETSLILSSNFETHGCLEIQADSYNYRLLNKSSINLSTRILDPKNLDPQPCWLFLENLKPLEPLERLLYFALS